MTTLRSHLLLPALLAAVLLPFQEERDNYCPDLDGRVPPELVVQPDAWVNIDGELDLAKLRGHVVWLEFSFIDCGGCRMMKPILYGLQHEFGARGLVVLEVDNGELDTRERLAQQVQRRRPNYPVLWDAEGATCTAYGVTRYGAAYLIGADGKVLWGGNPIQLTVVELWSMVADALGDVDGNQLRQAGPVFRLTNEQAPAAEPLPEAEDERYDIGYKFTICTADNSMVIDGVRTGSPAELSGLQKSDIVLSIDEVVLNEVPFDVLKAKLHELEEGPRTVEIVVEREGDSVRLVIEPPKKR